MKLFRARFLVPVAAGPMEDGALLIEGGRIAAVGNAREIAADFPRAQQVDFGEAILLPPLVNAHTHLELTHFPEWAAEAGEGKEASGSFVEWIREVIRIKRSVSLERFRPSLQAGIAASLAAGTGAAADILSLFSCRSAFSHTPLRGKVFLETLGLDPALSRKALEGLRTILAERRVGKIELALALHSPYTLSADYFEQLIDFARRGGISVTTHLAESPAEVEFLAESTGPLAERLYPYVGWEDMVPPPARRTPVTYLADRGGLVPWNLLAHGVQVGEEDARRLAEAGSTVVLCPRSNARLGVGRAPVSLYLREGVPLALGTDSRASSETLSVWDELAFARRCFSGEAGPEELLAMATVNGARALGLGREMGSLREGQGAHFQVLRPARLPSLAELAEFLCSPGRTAEVEALFLDGRDVLPRG